MSGFTERLSTGAFDNHGILGSTVAALSLKIKDDREHEYDFVPLHKPEEDNFSHSEMWAYSCSEQRHVQEPSRVARKIYRMEISGLFTILRAAQRCFVTSYPFLLSTPPLNEEVVGVMRRSWFARSLTFVMRLRDLESWQII